MIDIEGKRIVMTGATGFIGRNVAQQLLNCGAEVYALVRNGSKQRKYLPKSSNMHIMNGDLTHIKEALCEAGLLNRNFSINRDGDFIEGYLQPQNDEANDLSQNAKRASADIFLHFAWGGVNREEIDSSIVQQKNIEDSLVCLEAGHMLGCQLFMDAGSRVEYGVTEDGIMKEDMECHPVNAYGKAKLDFYQKAKLLCKTWGMTYEHLRYFSVYGVGDHPWSIISTLTRDLPLGKTVSLSACMHRWNFMDIEDASRAVLELIRHSDVVTGETHIINVASNDTRRLKEFVEEIHILCSGKGTLQFGTFVQAKEGALSICPDTEQLRILTENTWHEKVPFELGIRRIVEATVD